MQINEYIIIERAVFEGLAQGFAKATQAKEEEATPEKVLYIMLDAVMNEISSVIQFSNAEIETTEEAQEVPNVVEQKEEAV